MKKQIGMLAMGALGGIVAFGALAYFNQHTNPLPGDRAPLRFVNLPAGSSEVVSDFTTAAEKSINAVVHVKTETMREGYADPWTYFFGGVPHQIPSQSSGSGVILSEDGYIVTNNHVVQNATKVQVKLNNNEVYDAEVIGTDPASDLAVLKIDAKNLPFLAYGNSDDVKVGQWVLAVGNPFNLTSTVTAGIVSAKARNIHLLDDKASGNVMPIESFIQTDAAVNPGNSGGALVGSNGELLGINTAIASTTGTYAGYSFAIPVNLVKKVVNDLFEYGKVQRAFIGVSIRDLDKNIVSEQKLNSYKGVFVSDVNPGGAAEKAGIKSEDVILKVGDVPVGNTTELMEQVGKYRPGDKVGITVVRNGAMLSIPVVLQNMEGTTKLKSKSEETKEIIGLNSAEFAQASPEELNRLNLDHGVKVNKVTGGKLKEAGIKPGFIITKVDKSKVTTPSELANKLSQSQGGILIEGYYPNGIKAYYGLGQ
ncbi:MAG TPA: trypsin-like peptidase domain-containing protein [Luteibaculaceae bacterium]|nr:trypsin-like peptidase domain-containing protein [Luteibaculaceae bacterium]